MNFTPYPVPISCKGIVFEDGQVWLRQNERQEWELPGGKLEPGEQPEETVAREIEEELGLKVQVQAVVSNYLYTIKNSLDESHGVFVTSYLCRFIERTGPMELIGEGGPAQFKRFDPGEIEVLNMPEFYKTAIRRAVELSR